MTIQTAYNAVAAKAELIEPGTTELPTVQCGVTADGVECVASIRVAGGTSLPNGDAIPPAPTWEGALLILDQVLDVHLGNQDESALDLTQSRLRAVRAKAKADANSAAAQAELDRIDAT